MVLNLASILEAHQRLKLHSICQNTPIISSDVINDTISEAVGRLISVNFKCEHLQTVGSFKIRGALNFALSLPVSELRKGLITHSSGNHGAAVACVGKYMGVPVAVVIPRDAPIGKIERIRKYGATIHMCEPTLQDRQAMCSFIANDSGMTEVPPFDHDWIMAGQGTQAIEIIESVNNVDAIVVAVGGGGMLSGILTAVKEFNSSIKVFGIEPENANSTCASLQEKVRRGPTTAGLTTVCDALRVFPPGKRCWEIISQRCDGVFTVDDDSVIWALKLCLTELKQLVEPSGSCALAGVLSDEFLRLLRDNISIKNIVVVLCGGNTEIEFLRNVLV